MRILPVARILKPARTLIPIATLDQARLDYCILL